MSPLNDLHWLPVSCGVTGSMGDALHTSLEPPFLLLLSFPPKTSSQGLKGFSEDPAQTSPPWEAFSDFAAVEASPPGLSGHCVVPWIMALLTWRHTSVYVCYSDHPHSSLWAAHGLVCLIRVSSEPGFNTWLSAGAQRMWTEWRKRGRELVFSFVQPNTGRVTHEAPTQYREQCCFNETSFKSVNTSAVK